MSSNSDAVVGSAGDARHQRVPDHLAPPTSGWDGTFTEPWSFRDLLGFVSGMEFADGLPRTIGWYERHLDEPRR